MPGFEPILTPEQLPKEGSSIETLARDFKRLVAPAGSANRAELAKDVAAFANRIGGVLIIGAVEDTTRAVLDRYDPLSEQTAATVLKAASEAVSQFCSPQPIFEPQRLPKDGGFIVAINVWPFPGQAVGVRRTGDKDAFSFPLRTGADCTYLQPEQLPMLMIPELRRVIALLYAIPAERTVEVTNWVGQKTAYLFLKVDEVKNVVVLANLGHRPPTPFNVPLDGIESVWCSESGGWEIRRKF